ncbi:putative transcription factor AS2-LOB family [Rosa chinensis]|uniref:Putative transcription factor AS2-LOB family n=1 Tax=Rosa chinensis TaxID=74649 RepID=A0A2P6Q4F7_ROSCH|nr:putative transcription factor AS2-LOB family [Rosa chinensis]
MSIGSSNTGEPSGGRHACAACRHQRKRCEEDCVMAPYFTADKEEEFKAVHKLFGVSNMSKLLKQLEDQNHRAQAVQSFIWEAYMWKQDPIAGPLGKYKALEEECEYLRNLLNSSRPEQESMGVVYQGNTKGEVEGGGVPIYGRGLNYGYTDQTLGLDHGCTTSFTSLLQGQDTESSKGLADCVSVASAYQMPISQSQGRGFQDHRRIGMESFNFFHQYPTVQGANVHNYRPVQVQGRGRGTGGIMIDCARTCNGLVVYDPHTGQVQQREIGAMGPQVGPILSSHRRGTSQRFSPYDQHNPIQVPRQAMRQQDQNQQSFPAQHQWDTNSQSCDNFQGKGHKISFFLFVFDTAFGKVLLLIYCYCGLLHKYCDRVIKKTTN